MIGSSVANVLPDHLVSFDYERARHVDPSLRPVVYHWCALFVTLLVGTVILVGALTFFPALALGPIVEHYLMQDGKLFSLLLTGIWS